MPIAGMIINNEPVDFDDIPIDIMPKEAVNALRPQDRKGIHISNLTICPYTVTRHMFTNYYLPFKNFYKMVVGMTWDCLIEKYPRPNSIYHRDFSRQLGDVELFGQPDRIDTDTKAIFDFKRPERKMHEVPDNYIIQLNGYLWLTEGQLDVDIEKLYIQVMGPTEPQLLEVPMYDPFEVELELYSRMIDLYELVEVKNTKFCDDWKCVYCGSARKEIVK